MHGEHRLNNNVFDIVKMSFDCCSVVRQILRRRATNTQRSTSYVVCYSVEQTLLPLPCNMARKAPSLVMHEKYKYVVMYCIF